MKLSIFGHIFYCRLIKRDSQLKFLAGSHYFLWIKSTDSRGKGQPADKSQPLPFTPNLTNNLPACTTQNQLHLNLPNLANLLPGSSVPGAY
jgi:hypothetical protein